MGRCLAVVSLVMLGGALGGGPAAAQTPLGNQSSAVGATSLPPGPSSGVMLNPGPPLYGGFPGATVGRYQPRLLAPPTIEFGPAEAGFAPPPTLPGREVPLQRPRRPGEEEPPPLLEGPILFGTNFSPGDWHDICAKPSCVPVRFPGWHGGGDGQTTSTSFAAE